MDYYDPHLLAYGDEFPRGEAFRVDWGVDAGAGPRRLSLSIIPPKVFPKKSAPQMRAELCYDEHGRCDPVPGAVAVYFGSDQPRITVEATVPWRALGVAGPPPRPLRMQLAATAFHRSRWMSWNGLPPDEARKNAAGWRDVARRDLHGLRVARGRSRAKPRRPVRPEPPRSPVGARDVRFSWRHRPRLCRRREMAARGGLLGGEGARGRDARVRGRLPARRPRPPEEAHAARLGQRPGVAEGRALVARAAAAVASSDGSTPTTSARTQTGTPSRCPRTA